MLSETTELTFNRDIAPIVFQHCTPCHRAGQVAPFPLSNYRDVESRAEQIADVTKSRYMPPWKPSEGHARFVHVRRLTDEQIDLIRNWFESGMAEGEAKDLVAAPTFPSDWTLGKPDLVLKMAAPYSLPAGSADEFRSFVIPIPLEGVRYVRSLECRPSNPKVVHHADILFDPTSQSRELDALDPTPGFAGMRPVESASVGTLTGWAPGGTPIIYPEEMSWPLDPSNDLILTLHMLPTGKPEPVEFELGVLFSKVPPKRPSYLLRLASATIDIPAGKKDYEVRDEYELPVDVEAVGIRPHSHYLGKEVEVTADLPNDETIQLLKIDDWDFNWQDDYRFKQPELLPKGTVVRMRWVYDNSADNIRNPHSPPERVLWGAKSTDEMALALIQVLPFSQTDYRNLAVNLQRKGLFDRIDGYEMAIREDLDDVQALSGLNRYYTLAPEKEGIADRLGAAQRESPDEPSLFLCMGVLRNVMGEPDAAIKEFERALRLAPGSGLTRFRYAQALMSVGRMDECIAALQRVVDILPTFYSAYGMLGTAYAKSGQLDKAEIAFQKSLDLYGDQVECLEELGAIYGKQKDWLKAEASYKAIIALQPRNTLALVNLGVAIQNQNRHTEAIDIFNEALETDPISWSIHANLATCYLLQQDANSAIEHYEKSLQLNPNAWPVRMKFGELWLLVGEPGKAAAQFIAVCDAQPEFALAPLQAAQALKAAGKLDEALRRYRDADRLRPQWMPAAVGLAWVLATHPDAKSRDALQAIDLTMPFMESEKPHPIVLDTIAAAYAAQGRYEQAIRSADRALAIVQRSQNDDLARRIEARLRLYREGRPFVEDQSN